MKYQEIYGWLTSPLRKHPRIIQALYLTNRIIVAIVYALFCYILVLAAFKSWFLVSSIIIVSASGFVILSVVRKLINAPRPYEKYQIHPLIKRSKTGDSFPSRHVFSATLIGMCAFKVSFILGIILLVMALCLAIVRVIAGIHFPRDVIAGLLAGVSWGLLLFVI